MTAIARIVGISAVFYLVRFALGHQHRTRSKDSDSDSIYSVQEDSISSYEESNEKVLIRSGVPLRGRTIHQTAWSEEEKSPVAETNTLNQTNDQNPKENPYDSWSLTNAINYILSYIYGSEIDDNVIISNNLAGNSNENLKVPQKNFNEKRTHQTSIQINDLEKKSKKIPMVNKDSALETVSSYPIGHLQRQDIKWFRNEVSSLSDEYTSTESDTEDSELSNESTDSEYKEESYKYQVYGMINKDKTDKMHSLGSVNKDAEDESMRINTVKPLIEIRDRQPKFVSVEKSQESKEKSGINTRKKYKENGKPTSGYNKNSGSENTKDTFFDKNKIQNYNGYDKNRHPEQQSKSKSYSRSKNAPAGPLSAEDISTPKSMEEDAMPNNINYETNDNGKVYSTTERRNSTENIIIEIPPTTSHIQNQRKSQNKDLLSNSYFPTQTKKPAAKVDKKNLRNIYEVPRPFVTTGNINEFQNQRVLKNSNYVTKPSTKFSGGTQTYNKSKISSNKSKKDMKYEKSSITKKITTVPSIKPSEFPNVKPLKDRHQEYLKSKHRYLNDIYLDLEPDEDVRSYNYILDSYEFIRIDSDKYKANKKPNNSNNVIIKDKDHGSEKDTTTILSPPLTPFKDQSEIEKVDKSHDSFDTILEYLYKNSNSSFLLSLRE